MRIGFLAVLLGVVTLFPGIGLTQGRAGRAWQNDVFVYGIAASISGDVRYGRLEQSIDISFGDVLDSLQMGPHPALRRVPGPSAGLPRTRAKNRPTVAVPKT